MRAVSSHPRLRSWTSVACFAAVAATAWMAPSWAPDARGHVHSHVHSLAHSLTHSLAHSRAHAATLLALSLPELVSASDQIVVARAVAQSSRYRSDGQRVIVTDVELRVIESLKGNTKPGATLVSTQLGGSVGNLGLNVPGEASFPMDRSVIVFLERSQKGNELRVVGMSQGVLPIVDDAQGAQVLPASGDGQLLERDSDGKLRPGQKAIRAPRPLRDALTEIRRLVVETRAR
jgi:hypothetical protein